MSYLLGLSPAPARHDNSRRRGPCPSNLQCVLSCFISDLRDLALREYSSGVLSVSLLVASQSRSVARRRDRRILSTAERCRKSSSPEEVQQPLGTTSSFMAGYSYQECYLSVPCHVWPSSPPVLFSARLAGTTVRMRSNMIDVATICTQTLLSSTSSNNTKSQEPPLLSPRHLLLNPLAAALGPKAHHSL